MTGKILVVDDSKTDRLIIQKLLDGYELLFACDGVEAMSVMESNPDIAIMILDLHMPNMDGFQVLQAMKADDKRTKPRTIILTNYDEADNEIRGLGLGAVDYISKPVHMESLKARIEVHMELLYAKQALERQLQEQAATFETIFNQAPIGIAISYNKESVPAHMNQYFNMNPAFEKITGRTKQELLDIGWAAITHPDDLEEDMRNYEKLQTGEIDSYEIDKRYIKPDGSVVWVRMLVSSLVLSKDHSFNHIALVKDITQSKMTEQQLIESERSKSVLLSNLPGMAYRCKCDPEWTMQFVSSGCYALTGYNPENFINNTEISFNDVIVPEYRETLWNEWERHLTDHQLFEYEYEITTAAGTRKWVLEIGQGIYNSQGEAEAIEGIIIDISDRKQMENKLKYRSEHDGWTDLYNRECLEVLLSKDLQAISAQKRALVSINLGAMHSLSIAYGFQYSQKLIKNVAAALKQYCSDRCLLFNTYEYRFVFYLKGYRDQHELAVFCQRVSYTVNVLLDADRIYAGIGVYEISAAIGGDIEHILKCLLATSEEALRLGEEGNFTRFYDQALEERMLRRETLQHELSQVSAGDHQARLFLQYQPILDLRTNSICGFEALARFQSDSLGLVPPLEFIPIAEETKHIIPLGNLIIEKACRFFNKIRSAGHEDVNISINISAIQLLSKGFVQNLLNTVAALKVNPRHIIIELTESVFSSRFEEINKILSLLMEHGIRCAIDDFGTGYSSLSRERELIVYSLKIDKSFIDKLSSLNTENTITSDIISIAHKLGHIVVAEGVEDEKQLHYLREHFCDKVQGYFISRPLDEGAALAFLDNQSV